MTSSLPLFDADALPDANQVVGEMLSRARPTEAGHFDELRNDEGCLREHWARFASNLGAPLTELNRRQAILGQQIIEDGVTYNIYSAPAGNSRPWCWATRVTCAASRM
jgi:uncharacterized circularly permuted ATP-grasp superfamily protein